MWISVTILFLILIFGNKKIISTMRKVLRQLSVFIFRKKPDQWQLFPSHLILTVFYLQWTELNRAWWLRRGSSGPANKRAAEEKEIQLHCLYLCLREIRNYILLSLMSFSFINNFVGERIVVLLSPPRSVVKMGSRAGICCWTFSLTREIK